MVFIFVQKNKVIAHLTNPPISDIYAIDFTSQNQGYFGDFFWLVFALKIPQKSLQKLPEKKLYLRPRIRTSHSKKYV